jgi:glycosyltransferase involved in cell wall biosynthesis
MRPTVEIVIPAYNEQRVLRESVFTLHAHVRAAVPGCETRITIVDNASTDATAALGRELAAHLPAVTLLRVPEKGRGRALRAAWSISDADVIAYMDVDLSTDLRALAPLIQPLLDGGADLAIGSRLAPGAEVQRSLMRELVSRSYNGLLRAVLGASFSDAQCGFKAGRRETVQALLGAVENQTWFFDTELLYLAQRNGLRIHEVPVRWVEDRQSSVAILATALENLRGIARLRRRALKGADRVAVPQLQPLTRT